MPHKKKRLTRKKKNVAVKRNKHIKYEDIFGTSTLVGNKPTARQTVSNKSKITRVPSPFNRFGNHSSRKVDANKFPPMMINSTYYSSGLTPKEKNFIICTCQTKSTRYLKLKNLAANAIKENKIFSVYGSCNAVRKALLDRGWVEKIPANRMNLSKIRNGTFSNKNEIHSELERLLLSNFVEKYNPNFVWRTRDDVRDTAVIDMTKECNTIVNKLKADAMWTSKQGLCSSIKRNYWFYIENVAEVNSPRTYNSYDVGEIEGFVKDFKITACTSLLKWILSMVANERPIFIKSGKISMNVIVFALNRCKEYLFRKEHKDIDRTIATASLGQWNSFLKKYYRIIAKEDVFQTDKRNMLKLYLCYAEYLLKEIHRYRPQLSCEGCHNIWIIKPAHCSRGRGIRMASKLGVITNLLNKANSKYVIQKYIEEPLLIYETKFDIRQYYLITSTYPLEIWMYRDCYLKFSSQRYNLKNYHESIHLTNNAVQRKYNNCVDRHAELPQHNMWDSDKYKCYLNNIGKDKVWDNLIYSGMKRSIIGIMLNCQDSLSVCKNCFELYGCDFILDKEYKPWLIEINSCPDLNHTTQVTAKICPAVVSDIIKASLGSIGSRHIHVSYSVVIDHAGDPKASTGKFECIYRQPMTIPRYGSAAELVIRGLALPYDYFYRGNIEIQESYYDADIDEERDIKGILNRLKQYYAPDTIMVQPEDDYEIEQREKETCTRELHVQLLAEAGILTDQLEDGTIEKITSAGTSSSASVLIQDTLSSPLSEKSLNCTHCLQSTKSVTDFKSLIKKSISRFTSEVEIVNVKQSFIFSKLDDGPRGKGSFLQIDGPVQSALYNVSPSHTTFKMESRPLKSSLLTEDSILQATTKLISFINEKEKEYLEQHRGNKGPFQH